MGKGRTHRANRVRTMAIAGIVTAIALTAAWPASRGSRERRAVRGFLPDPAPTLRDAASPLAERLQELDHRVRTARRAIQAAGELARLYDANWRAAEASMLYEALADRLDRDNPRWAYALAGLLGGRGDLAGARRRFEQVLALQPDYLPARLKLAEVDAKLGDIAAAKSVLAAGNGIQPPSPQVLLAQARLETADPVRARQLAEAAVAADPQFSPGWTWLAEFHSAAGRTVEAGAARDHAGVGSKPTDLDDPWEASVLDACFDPNRLRVAASAAATARRLEQASRWIERAAELAPGDPAVQRERGRIWRAAGDWRQARRSFELAAKLEPSFADNWANLHDAQLHESDPAAAAHSLDEGLRLHPQSPGLHLASARRYAATGRPAEAMREYRESIRLRPQESVARIELSSLLFKQDAVAEGVSELRAALDAEPDHPLALSTLTFVHIGLGDEAAARHWLMRARRQPRLPRADLAALEQRFREQFHSDP